MIDADLSRYAQQLWIQGIFSARYSYQIDDLFAQMLFVLSQPGILWPHTLFADGESRQAIGCDAILPLTEDESAPPGEFL